MRLKSFFLLTLLPCLVNALGIGKIELRSSLNEQLDARVELRSATTEELENIKIGLADQKAFDRVGIERVQLLTRLKFTIEETKQKDYIRISSNELIREPFLHFLLEVDWVNGHLLREYTVLLDPPTYQRAESLPKERVKALSGQDLASTDADISRTDSSYSGSGDYGPTVTGDTLWSIAKKMRPNRSISIQQMMLALQRANPDTFISGNINGLKRGVVLNMPTEAELKALNKSVALQQVKSQYALWDQLRGKTAAKTVPHRPPVTVTPQVPPSTVAPPAASVAQEDTVAAEAKLRLVAPSSETTATGDDALGASENADIMAVQRNLALANETIEAMSLSNTELNDRLLETEGIVDDLERLIAMKQDQLAVIQEQVLIGAKEEQAISPTESTVDDSQLAPNIEDTKTEPSQELTVQADSIEPEEQPIGFVPKLLSKATAVFNVIKTNLLLIGFAIVLLVAIVAVAIFVRKRKSTTVALEEEALTFSGVSAMSKKVPSDTDNIDSEGATQFSEQEEVNDIGVISDGLVDVPEAEAVDDPMAEVNVFLAYEYFDEAEAFVRQAIADAPDNVEYYGKLLEVFYASGNKKAYEETAKILHEKTSGKGEYWDSAAAMWQEISPNRNLFETPLADEEATSSSGSGGGIVNIAGDEESVSEMDFDLAGGGVDLDATPPSDEPTEGKPQESGGDILDQTIPNTDESEAKRKDALNMPTDNTDDVGISLDIEPSPLDRSVGESTIDDGEIELSLSEEDQALMEASLEKEDDSLTGTAKEGKDTGEEMLSLDIEEDELPNVDTPAPSKEDTTNLLEGLDMAFAEEEAGAQEEAIELDIEDENEEGRLSDNTIEISASQLQKIRSVAAGTEEISLNLDEKVIEQEPLDMTIDETKVTDVVDESGISFSEDVGEVIEEEGVLDIGVDGLEVTDLEGESDISLSEESLSLEETIKEEALDIGIDGLEVTDLEDESDISLSEESPSSEEAIEEEETLDIGIDGLEVTDLEDESDISLSEESLSLEEAIEEEGVLDIGIDEPEVIDAADGLDISLLEESPSLEEVIEGEGVLDIGIDEPEVTGLERESDISLSEESLSLEQDAEIVEPEQSEIEEDVQLSDNTLEMSIDSIAAIKSSALVGEEDIEEEAIAIDEPEANDVSEKSGISLSGEDLQKIRSAAFSEEEKSPSVLTSEPVTKQSADESTSIDELIDFEIPTVEDDAVSEIPTLHTDDDVDDMVEEEDRTVFVGRTPGSEQQTEDEEMASQLDLAKAYIELGDSENAKTILDEVIAQGSNYYSEQANELLSQV